jgi:hypothetical protein
MVVQCGDGGRMKSFRGEGGRSISKAVGILNVAPAFKHRLYWETWS